MLPCCPRCTARTDGGKLLVLKGACSEPLSKETSWACLRPLVGMRAPGQQGVGGLGGVEAISCGFGQV